MEDLTRKYKTAIFKAIILLLGFQKGTGNAK